MTSSYAARNNEHPISVTLYRDRKSGRFFGNIIL